MRFLRATAFFSLLASVTMLSSQVLAGDLSAQGFVGIEKFNDKDKGLTQGLNSNQQTDAGLFGATLGAQAQYEFFGVGPLGVYGGAGLKYSGLKFELPNNYGKLEMKVPQLSAEAGANVGFLVLKLQGSLGLDYGLSGSSISFAGSGMNPSWDIDSFSRTTLNARAMLSLIPLISFGVGAQYFTGTIKMKPAAGMSFKPVDFSGYAVIGVVNVNIPLL